MIVILDSGDGVDGEKVCENIDDCWPNACGNDNCVDKVNGYTCGCNEQFDGFPKHDELKSVFVDCETEDEEFGVQDDGLPILCADTPG